MIRLAPVAAVLAEVDQSALDALKAVDAPAYQAAVAAVQKIDPHFLENSKK